MNAALLAKLEGEQAAGWPTPPTWGPDYYPDPVLTEYIQLISETVEQTRRSNTRAYAAGRLASTYNEATDRANESVASSEALSERNHR